MVTKTEQGDLNIQHVLGGLQQKSGGPSYCVPALATALVDRGCHVGLHVLGPAEGEYPKLDLRCYSPWRFSERLGYSPSMYKGLQDAARQADIIHNHGLWMLPNMYAAWAAKGVSCQAMTSLHGTLAPQALVRSRWKKRFIWRLCQAKALRDTACLHATSSEELRNIRRCHLNMPVAVIPNGVDVPSHVVKTETFPRRLVFLGRIHPIKGIDYLLQAWRQIQHKAMEWELHLVGGGERRHVLETKQLAKKLRVERVLFRGPIYGVAKTKLLRKADIVVLPSRSENFGIVVAESLAYGVPVIVSQRAPWSGLVDHECGWWIEPGSASLYECLHDALQNSPSTLRRMGQRGRDWVSRDFSWSRVGDMMYQTYAWLLGGGAAPNWVDRQSTVATRMRRPLRTPRAA